MLNNEEGTKGSDSIICVDQFYMIEPCYVHNAYLHFPPGGNDFCDWIPSLTFIQLDCIRPVNGSTMCGVLLHSLYLWLHDGNGEFNVIHHCATSKQGISPIKCNSHKNA